MTDLIPQIDRILGTVSTLKSTLTSMEESLDLKKKEEDRLIKSFEMNTKALVVMTSLFERLNERGLTELDKLMQGALNQVFPNRDYTVYHEITQERGYNNLNFYLKEVNEDGRIQISNIRNAVGGSIRAISGLVCLTFYLMKMNAEHFIALDEALSQVDDSAVDGLFGFLKSLGKEAGFKFILVTHDQRFKPYFDKIYEVKIGGKVEKIR